MARIAAQFQEASEGVDRYKVLLTLAKDLPPMETELRADENRVMGCSSQVWLAASLDAEGRVAFQGDSDSEISKGLCAVLVQALSGMTADEILKVDASFIQSLGLGPAVLAPSRANGFYNMLESAKKRAGLLVPGYAGPRFPSLVVSADDITAQGPFAEAQAQYLQPDQALVDKLVAVCREKRIGIVAHFYMDPEVQGVLMSAAEQWPYIFISDSLVMADRAVKMVEEGGLQDICVLGVDFMSENVRAILDDSGHTGVGVYRMAEGDIGCSLAEAAESAAYQAYLEEAGRTPNALHVVYINTSLVTKATAHGIVPTITCTSSNVVQTVLQAFAQVPDLALFYGPDAYMGANLVEFFTQLAAMPDEEIRALHPAHDRASVANVLARLRYFEDGSCIVHDIFGAEVTDVLRKGYGDAYLTAHLEVPGEMFKMAMEARQRDMGAVGSTQNILDFIALKVEEALSRDFDDRLQFVLGTEAGMVTSIVRKVQAMLQAAPAGGPRLEVEVVFPVASEAIAQGEEQGASPPGGGALGDLTIVPGVAGGEGCSLEGGCASCPYMKMNSLTALLAVCERVGGAPGKAALAGFEPRAYGAGAIAETGPTAGMSVAQAGCVSILHMRGFQKDKSLPAALAEDIVTRH